MTDLHAIQRDLERVPPSEMTLTALVLEHDTLNRWLNLPGAELWADEHAEKSARIVVVWRKIQLRKRAAQAPQHPPIARQRRAA